MSLNVRSRFAVPSRLCGVAERRAVVLDSSRRAMQHQRHHQQRQRAGGGDGGDPTAFHLVILNQLPGLYTLPLSGCPSWLMRAFASARNPTTDVRAPRARPARATHVGAIFRPSQIDRFVTELLDEFLLIAHLCGRARNTNTENGCPRHLYITCATRPLLIVQRRTPSSSRSARR